MAATFALTTGVVYVRSWSGTVSGASQTLSGDLTVSGNTDIGGAAGVRLTAANGILTMLGLGAGADENFLVDLNTTANSVILSSGTGANIVNFSEMVPTGTRAGIAATSTDGIVAQNSTASTSGVTVQQSPRIRLRSNVWNTTVTAANNTDDWIIESVPVSGLTPSGVLKIGSSLNGAAYTFPLTITSAGQVRFQDGSGSAPSITFASDPDTGFFWQAAKRVDFTSDSVNVWSVGESNQNMAADYRLSWANDLLLAGNSTNSELRVPSDARFGFAGNVDPGLAVLDTYITRPAAGQFVFNGASAAAAGVLSMGAGGTATSVWRASKKVTAIGDNSATTVFTVTVPNANHAAAIKLTFLSSNGGADAFESSRVATGHVVVARTAGANAVVTAATIDDAAIATVSGGATHTLAYSVSAVSGGVTESNTFTIQVTIDDTGNLGGNQVVTLAELINAEATGVTIA